MRVLRVVATLPLWLLLGAATPAPSPSPTPAPNPSPSASPSPSPTPSPSPSPSPTPVPTPTPVNAFISLDVTAGPPDTAITVNGSAFLANEPTSLYWDVPTHVAGASNADANGNFTTRVKPFPGDSPGIHKLCASVPPNPCASFTLQAAVASPSASPSPSPSPDASPSPAATPSPSASPTAAATTINGLELMMKPPFVILPIIAAAGFAIALGYWILSLVMRPRTQTLKSVTVAHVASRPDYSAGFGTPPPVPAPAAPEPSAWTDSPLPPPAPSTATAPPEAMSPPEATAPPDVDWDAPAPEVDQAPPPAPDEPPDLPEPGDY